jgi:hypothetical protein
MFHDCSEVDLMGEGGSDSAGFVQIIQGKTKDVARSREMDKEVESRMEGLRPDVLGGFVAWHPENGRFTNPIYFTSEAEARANEKKMESEPEFQKMMSEFQELSDGEPKFIDLPEPWFSTK